MLVSMVPVIELRGGVPFGAALGLNPWAASTASVLGNLIPPPFIIVYIRRIFLWMRRHIPSLNDLVDKLEHKAHLKGQKVTKYKYLGLLIFVAIPLPGTGAWTGAPSRLCWICPCASLSPAMTGGVVTAGFMVTFVTGRGGDFRHHLNAFFRPRHRMPRR